MTDPLTEAALVVNAVGRSGFPCDMALALHYEMSGPVVGSGGVGLPGSAVVEPWELTQLIADLEMGSLCAWAAAVVDGQVWLASGRAMSYIPPGVHLPHNAGLVVGQVGDGVFPRAYGWPPAERLVAYARHQGWLDRITTLVARRQFGAETPGPFDWVRPMMCGGIELVEIPHNAYTWNIPRWGSAAHGGRHRLSVLWPDRYAELVDEISAGGSGLRRAVEAAAELTVAAARRAAAHVECAFADYEHCRQLGLDFPDKGPLQKSILDAVVAAEPHEIAGRRMGDRYPKLGNGFEGLPADEASTWGGTVDRAFRAAEMNCRVASMGHYGTVHGATTSEVELVERWDRYAAAELVAVALEAVMLWSADPLPVADIEYAARQVVSGT